MPPPPPVRHTRAAGELFIYDDEVGYSAFEFGATSGDPLAGGHRALICVGGLTDGFLSLRYLPVLAEAVKERGWRTVQPQLSSSYGGWGFSSLDQDVQELDKLIEYLEAHRGIREVVLLGCSTGCQDTVRFLQFGERAAIVSGAILQAPVSDREALIACAADKEHIRRYRSMASELIADRHGDEMLPRAAGELIGPPHPVSAYRFNSLTGRMTDDDMFSSDLTDDEMRAKLGHITVPTLIVVSADDEYVPKSVDAEKLASRMADAMAGNAIGIVDIVTLDANHNCSQPHPEAGRALSEAVRDFVAGIDTRPKLTWEPAFAKHMREMAAFKAEAGMEGPLLVALAGMPGSGKSTSSKALHCLLGPECLVAPMDGFHLPLASLRKRKDADEAIYRRGAPDTFEPGALKARLDEIREDTGPSTVRRLAQNGPASTVDWPSFDHSVGDPVPGNLRFHRNQHRMVLIEGLYLLHNGDGWHGVAERFDHRVYLEADLEECLARVKVRNRAIPGYTPEEIDERTDKVDRANALIVQASAGRADAVVQSAAGAAAAAAALAGASAVRSADEAPIEDAAESTCDIS